MRSSFFGLNVGAQGLYTARTNLDITGHNISNADTEGYSRQYGVQKAQTPIPYTTRGMVGTGFTIERVDQYRDSYLDYKFRDIQKNVGEYTQKHEMLQQMELIFNEPTEVGFTSHFDNIFKKLQKLSTDTADFASRTSYIDTVKSFTKYLNDAATQLRDLQNEANFGIKTEVDSINTLSEQIALINNQIGNLELTGDKANDLRDERNKLIDKLSKVVGIDVRETKDVNGKENVRITINGQSLVNGNVAHKLKVVPRKNLNNPEDNPDLYDIKWETGRNFYVTDANLRGELKGYMEIRDGNNLNNFKGKVMGTTAALPGATPPVAGTVTVSNTPKDIRHDLPVSGTVKIDNKIVEYTSYSYNDTTKEVTFTLKLPTTPSPTAKNVEIGDSVGFKGIPYYMQKLNQFCRTIAKEFNKIQEAGDGGTGIPFLVNKGYTGTPPLDINVDSSYDKITVDNFSVNDKIVKDVSLLKTKSSDKEGESANDLIMKLLDLRHDNTMFEIGEPDNYMQGLISELAIDTNEINSFKTASAQMEVMVKNQKLSVSDVDLDEEATNLVKYQRAYNMSAKIISVFDEIYNVTINQMGV